MGELIHIHKHRNRAGRQELRLTAYTAPATPRSERFAWSFYTIGEWVVSIAIIVAVLAVLGLGVWR